MWESKSFQTKLPVFKRELAENGRASFSASYGNRPVEALLAKIMIKDKLIKTVIDSGSSVNLLSVTLYQQLGELSQTRVCNKNIIAANNEKMPVKGSTTIQIQLQIFSPEITVEFLVTKIEITPFFLGMEFLYDYDCILNL